MPYRDDEQARERHLEALTRERDELAAAFERARAALASAVAELAGLPAEAEVPWRSLHGGEPITVELVNRTGAPVTLLWLGHDGRPHPETTLVDGGRWRVETHTGVLWRMVGPSGRVIWQRYARAGHPTLEVLASDAP